MPKPIIPMSQSIYDAKGDQLTYSTWLKINRALASASGAGGSTDLGPISGLLASTSGYLQTQISDVSGTLHNEIVSVSGFLVTNSFGYDYRIVSGSLYNNTFTPLPPVSGTILRSSLDINGFIYVMDETYGYTLDYAGDQVLLSWNYTSGNGFSLVDTDFIVFHFLQ